MSVNRSEVFLRDGASGQLVPAELFDQILDRHLDHHEQHWQVLIAGSGVEHGHWDWRDKMAACAPLLAFQSFAIECGAMTQGLMIVNSMERCRLPVQANKHLVYVEYLEAAPWNRGQNPRYKGVGTVMRAAAIQFSFDEGNRGRIGLHSLPQADAFYRDRCGMTDLGPDRSYPKFPLTYFEMTESQAARFLAQGMIR